MPDPANHLLQRVRDSLAGSYDLLGELGADEAGETLYLARELATGTLVGVSLKQDDDDGTEYTVEVRRTLGETVAVRGSSCPECRAELPDLDRYCFQCGADLAGVLAPDDSPEAAHLLGVLASATTGRYDILGRMTREGQAGTVYFARELSGGRIVALRLRRAEPGDAVQAEYVVRQTATFRAPYIPLMPAVTPGVSSPPVSAPPVSAPAHASGATPLYVPTPAPQAHGDSTQAPFDDHATAAAPRSRRSLLTGLAGGVVLLMIAAAYFAMGDDAPNSPSVASATPPAVTPPTAVTDSTGPLDAGVLPSDTAAFIAPASPDSGNLRIVTAIPAGARVTIDGRPVRGRTLRLPAGSYQMAVVARGYQPFTQRVTVRTGTDINWAPRLVATTLASADSPASSPDSTPRARSAPTCRSAMRAEDWTNAYTLCTTEATAGEIAASSSLGQLYARGLGTRRNPTQAYTWYAKAAAGGDRDGMTALGYALRDGSEVKRDPAASVQWFKQAAEAGDRSAALEYAVALERGDGITRDERSARQWYRTSADLGNFMAARRLGRMLERGVGGPRSEPDAAVAYERAASLGDAESALVIGKWYRDGKGVAKSPEQALTWFRKAAELGNAEAQAEVKRLEKGAM